MTDISSWRQTLEPSGRLLDPERIATIIFGHTIRIFTELTNGETYVSLEPAILDALNEQKDRYKLWGSNFNAQNGGLDKFLDGASRMRETLLPILCRMAGATVAMARQSNLPEALEAVYQQTEEIKKQVGNIGPGKPASFEDDDDERLGRLDDLAQTFTIDDFSSSESEGSSHEEVSVVAEALQDIEFSNDLLYNLGPALYDNAERTATKQRYSNMDVNKDQATMQVWYTNSILSAYPSIETALARRLGEAMEIRVHRLEESRTQANKLSSDSDTESTSEDPDDTREIPTASSQSIMSQASSEFTAPSTQISSMFDSQPINFVKKKNYISKSAASATSFAPSLVDESTSSQKRGIPKIPNDNGLLKVFDCTLCGSQLSSVFNTISWVKHVYQDLQPYVCTVEGCELGSKTFMSRHDWVEHEFSKHRHMAWTCDICNLTLSKELDIKNHVAKRHGDLDDLKYESLLKSASQYTAIWIQQQSCPICKVFSAHTKRQFVSHLGRHLQEISHAAIPSSVISDDHMEIEEDTDDETTEEGKGRDTTVGEVEEPGQLESRPSDKLTSVDDDDNLKKTLTRWLQGPDPAVIHNAAVRQRLSGTCHWFIESENFLEWTGCGFRTFWIADIPGAGKTVLCSAIIVALQEIYGTITIYYYFDFKDSETTGASSFFKSILRQLIEQCRLPNLLLKLEPVLNEEQQLQSDDRLADQLVNTLLIIASSLGPHVFFVIDALDESMNPDVPFIMESLERIMRKCGLVSLLFTTRHHFEIGDHFESFPLRRMCISEQMENQDIKKYISFRLQNDKRMAKWPTEVKEEVLQTLNQDAAGMFRWVEAQLDVLRQCPNVRSIKTALKDSPRALDEIYDRALRSIPSENVQDASRLLQWLCFCARPMTALDLVEVIAVDLDRLVFDPDLRYIEVQNLFKTCGPLIKLEAPKNPWQKMNPETEVVQFCHESVRAYLVSNRLREFRIHFEVTNVSANACIAKTCLIYIIHVNSFDGGLNSLDLVPIFPLLQYALREWPRHYRKVIGRDQQEELDKLAYKLPSLEKSFRMYELWFAASIEVISPIYYSCLSGITGVVSMLLEEGIDPDEPPFGRWGTALGAACHAGHGDVVELLVEHGAQVETSSSEGLTPLHLAAQTLGARLVSMLIDNGTEDDYVDRRDSAGWSALHWAARSGKEETVQLLLDNGADVLAADKEDATPLDAALSQGREEIVQLLVNYGADVDAFHRKYGTRLRHAARSGDERAVRILLKVGADPNLYRDPKPLPKYCPGTPLQEAVSNEKEGTVGHENIVKLLLAAGADPNLGTTARDTGALLWAAGAGNPKIVKLLLDAGAEVNPAPSDHTSPLKTAVKEHKEEVVRLLLAAGADPNPDAHSASGTPLRWAIRRKMPVMEQILRDHGATDHISEAGLPASE